jgi:hypothetical protein
MKKYNFELKQHNSYKITSNKEFPPINYVFENCLVKKC